MIRNHFDSFAKVCDGQGDYFRYPNSSWILERLKVLPSMVRIGNICLFVKYTFVNRAEGLRYRFWFREYSGGGPFEYEIRTDRYKTSWVFDGGIDPDSCQDWCDRVVALAEDPHTELVIDD